MLVRQSLSGHPESSLVFETTSAYFEGELPQSDFRQILGGIANTPAFISESRACLVMGYGANRKRTYDQLRTRGGVEILWSGTFLPWWASPLGVIVASYGGVIRIHNPAVLPDVFGTLSQLAMVELVTFQSSVLNEARTHVLRHKRATQIAQAVCKDDSYFCFGVDGDVIGSPNVKAWCSYGKNCPQGLLGVIAEKVESVTPSA